MSSRGPLTPAQQALVNEHSPRLVRAALRVFGAKYRGLLSPEDIEQAARLGVTKAASEFDAEKGPFDAFAWKHAKWRVIDAAGDEARPRYAERALVRAMSTVTRRGSVLGDTPEDTREELQLHARSAATALVLAFARAAAEAPDALLEARQRLAALHDELAALEPEARRLVELHYFEDKKLADVAELLGLKLMTARRRHEAAVNALAARLT